MYHPLHLVLVVLASLLGSIQQDQAKESGAPATAGWRILVPKPSESAPQPPKKPPEKRPEETTWGDIKAGKGRSR
jgi:hypothetical protein